MALFTLPPEAKKALADVDAFRQDLSAIRQLLERLLAIEEARERQGHVQVNHSVSA